MNLPTVKECEQLFRQYHVPTNIEAHCKAVSTFAKSLAQRLKARNININVELVQIGALLHDLMKAVTLDSLQGSKKFPYTPNEQEIAMWKHLRETYPHLHETRITYDILAPKYPELAQFIKDEGEISHPAPDTKPTATVWEVKVVHYADWRFIGTTFVPLKVRMDDLFQRYANKRKIGGIHNWGAQVAHQQNAEKEMCDALQCKPEDL